MGYFYINWASVFVATIAAYAVGALWHGPLFGKQWIKLNEFTPASMKKMKLSPAKAMTMGFFSTLFMAFFVAFFISWLGKSSPYYALKLAFFLWLGIQVPLLLSAFLWEGKSIHLFAFNAFYRLVEIAIIAGIIAIW